MLDDMPSPGTTVGPWLLLDRMGAGTFGVVFRARRAGHPDAPPVALKMAKAPEDARFEREAELLQHNQHPGIPRFEDCGLWTAPSGDQYPYLVMDLVKGFALYDWFQGGRTSREVLEVLAQVAGALASAHARGAVHRDVKGDNIRVTPEGRAVLVDWGSGWFAGARPLTDTTTPPGTTAYRPPEQRFFTWRFRKDMEARWQAQPTDDLYSLGVALYRMVTGRYLPPLSEGGEVEHVREVPPPCDYATVSRDLEALLLRLLSNEREQRGTAAALAREAAALATAAGEAADKPIVPTASAQRTDSGGPSSDGLEDGDLLSDTDTGRRETSSPPSPPRSTQDPRRSTSVPPAWLISTLAAMVGGLAVALVLVLVMLLARPAHQEDTSPPWIATPEEVEQFAPDAGVGDEALASAYDVPRAVMPLVLTVGTPIPKQPHEGQKRPPCGPGQIAVNGGCWAGPIEGQRPPCGHGMFEYENRCYFAIYDAPGSPPRTSHDRALHHGPHHCARHWVRHRAVTYPGRQPVEGTSEWPTAARVRSNLPGRGAPRGVGSGLAANHSCAPCC